MAVISTIDRALPGYSNLSRLSLGVMPFPKDEIAASKDAQSEAQPSEETLESVSTNFTRRLRRCRRMIDEVLRKRTYWQQGYESMSRMRNAFHASMVPFLTNIDGVNACQEELSQPVVDWKCDWRSAQVADDENGLLNRYYHPPVDLEHANDQALLRRRASMKHESKVCKQRSSQCQGLDIQDRYNGSGHTSLSPPCTKHSRSIRETQNVVIAPSDIGSAWKHETATVTMDSCPEGLGIPTDRYTVSKQLQRLFKRLVPRAFWHTALSKHAWPFLIWCVPAVDAIPLSTASTRPIAHTMHEVLDVVLALIPFGVLVCGFCCAYRTLKASRPNRKEPVLLSVQVIVVGLVWWAIGLTVNGPDNGKNIAISVWAALLMNNVVRGYRILRHRNQFLIAWVLGGVFSTVLFAALASIDPNVGSSMQRVVEQAINSGPFCLSVWNSFVFWPLLHVERNEQQTAVFHDNRFAPDLPYHHGTASRPGLHEAYHRGAPSSFLLVGMEDSDAALDNPW